MQQMRYEIRNVGPAAWLAALACQDATRLVPNYHTRLDTIEHVRPQSLSVMLQLVLDMIEEIDRCEWDVARTG